MTVDGRMTWTEEYHWRGDNLHCHLVKVAPGKWHLKIEDFIGYLRFAREYNSKNTAQMAARREVERMEAGRD